MNSIRRAVFKIFLMLILLALASCGSKTSDPLEVEIIAITDSPASGMSACFNGSLHNSVVKAPDGHVYDVRCRYLGEVGDLVTGCVVYGHWDSIANGFRTGERCIR